MHQVLYLCNLSLILPTALGGRWHCWPQIKRRGVRAADSQGSYVNVKNTFRDPVIPDPKAHSSTTVFHRMAEVVGHYVSAPKHSCSLASVSKVIVYLPG
jgi:hypothetical protein